jgi:hypothetical protein
MKVLQHTADLHSVMTKVITIVQFLDGAVFATEHNKEWQTH